MIYNFQRNFWLLFGIHTTQYEGFIRIKNMKSSHLKNAIGLGIGVSPDKFCLPSRLLYWKRAVIKFRAELERRGH